MMGALLKREWQLVLARSSDLLQPLFFFAVVIALFPLAISPEAAKLSMIAPGVVWVAALLAVLLSVESLFRADHESGALDQLLASPHSVYLAVLAKLLVHWLVCGLPLVILAPLAAYMLHLPSALSGVLVVSLLLGTPTLLAIGAVGAALTVGLRQGGTLLAILVLPLYVPVLVFGAGVVARAADGFAVGGIYALLGALCLASVSLAPLAVVAGLRISSGN